LVQHRYPEGVHGNKDDSGCIGRQIRSTRLCEAARKMKIDTISQLELDDISQTERDYNLGIMRHNAAGDAEITVRIFMAVVLESIKQREFHSLKEIERQYLQAQWCTAQLEIAKTCYAYSSLLC
jgi:DNA polymerase III alpha subunit (gram-positive type)